MNLVKIKECFKRKVKNIIILDIEYINEESLKKFFSDSFIYSIRFFLVMFVKERL